MASDKHDTRTADGETPDWKLEKQARKPYSRDREDSAVLAAMIVSAGAATFLATWGSGVMGSGLPRVGYFVGVAIVSWFVLTFVLSNGILAIDGWLE